MRSIAIGLLGMALIHGGAAAQTVLEQAQMLRDFQQNVTDYTQRHRCADPEHQAAPALFSLPVAMVFRQVIAKALDERGHATAMRGVGHALPLEHHPVVFEPFLTTELHEFPPVLLRVATASPSARIPADRPRPRAA